MDAGSRRKCFAERSYSHDHFLRNKAFSVQQTESSVPGRSEPFSTPDPSPPVSRSAGFRGKLSRTDSSIIVISRCSGNSAVPAPKVNSNKQSTPKKKPKIFRQSSLSSFLQKHFSNSQRKSQQSPKTTELRLVPKALPAASSTGQAPGQVAKPPDEAGCVTKTAGRNTSPLTSPNLLGVPNIFTTAFSRSPRAGTGAGCDVSPDDIRLTEHTDTDPTIRRTCSKSTPELQDVTTGESPGELDTSRRERRPSDDATQQITALLQCNRYKDIHVCEVLDYLFMGSIEAAYHEPLLCKLGIDSLIDISNIPAEKVPYHKKSDCPCMCTSRTRHLRAKLYVAVDDNPTENIEQYFAEINSFIEGVRRCGKRVLIYSYHGNSRAPTAVIQHLMTQKNLLLRQSFNLVKNQRPSIKLNPGFRATLEYLERKLFPAAKPSLSFENEFVNVANPQLVKTAWADC